MKFGLPFDPAKLRHTMREGFHQGVHRASDTAARVQARLEHGATLRMLRLGGDVAVALGSLAMQHGQEAAAPFAKAARGGVVNGALTSAAIAATLHLHRKARGEISWREAIAGTGRETFCGAGSGAASTLAASASTIALGAIGAPFIAKAAAPAMAAALAGWLAQEAAEKGLQMAQDWALVPDHALPENRPESQLD